MGKDRYNPSQQERAKTTSITIDNDKLWMVKGYQ